ncbi:MAG: hypothetical protein Q8M23_05720 [Bacteroidales bacterium]|nr:hypothetical protein [Bacteroidales bacterium]
MANNRQTFLAIGLLSACVIAAQIVLMQLLSFVQWHHFAYLVISIAMLGFGAAGTCIAFFRARLTRNYKVVLPVLAFMAGVSLTMALRLSQTQFLMFDLYHLFIDCLQYPRLLLTVLVFFVPFFFAALFVGILFTIKVAHINLLYFSNLVGSGAGGLLALLLLGLVYPWHAYSIIAVLMLLSGFLIIDFKQTAMAIAAVFIFIAVVTAEFVWPVQIKPSQYKGFSKMLNLPDAKIIDEKQGIFGLTQTVSSPMMRYAPGVSFNFQGEIPVSIAVFTNADFSGVIPTFHLHAAHPLHFTTFSLPYALANPDTVLVLNAGTGYFAGHAIIENARYVVATEPNHQLADIIKKHLTPLLDSLPGNPVLEIKQTSARSYIEKLPMRFNLIVLPVLDAFGGSSGLYAMQENYLMTSEGFVKVFNALKPGGLMAVSCWLDYPVRTPLKILTTLMEMFNKAGIENVKNHLVAIRSWGTITFVAGNQPFALESTSAVREFCDSLSFDPMILPGLAGDERDYYNAYGDKIFFELVDAIILGNADDLFTHYPFYLRPSTDDKPYFSQFLRWKAIPELAEIFGKQQVPL